MQLTVDKVLAVIRSFLFVQAVVRFCQLQQLSYHTQQIFSFNQFTKVIMNQYEHYCGKLFACLFYLINTKQFQPNA